MAKTAVLSQKVPKFELYKHNDELFDLYYGIFYQLNFCRIWPIMQIRKKGDEILRKSSPLKLLSQSQPNFAEMILGLSPFKIVSVSAVLYPRWRQTVNIV